LLDVSRMLVIEEQFERLSALPTTSATACDQVVPPPDERDGQTSGRGARQQHDAVPSQTQLPDQAVYQVVGRIHAYVESERRLLDALRSFAVGEQRPPTWSEMPSAPEMDVALTRDFSRPVWHGASPSLDCADQIEMLVPVAPPGTTATTDWVPARGEAPFGSAAEVGAAEVATEHHTHSEVMELDSVESAAVPLPATSTVRAATRTRTRRDYNYFEDLERSLLLLPRDDAEKPPASA